jgi:uncharacterized protein YndB with AHSA1/START domain
LIGSMLDSTARDRGRPVAERPDRVGPERVGITITRIFDAPPARVWQEWTKPAAFADWFGGVDGAIPLSSVAMDVREGGHWQLTMFAGPDRRQIDWRGEYLEVVEPSRLVFTISDQPGSDDYELVTVALTDLGDGRTEMLFQQRGRLSEDEYERAGSGWSGFFDRMDERVTAG